MNREEKILFLINAIRNIEGILLKSTYFKYYSEDQLDDEIEWMEYLSSK